MKLTEHFYLDEFLISETAERFGIDNTPNKEQLANILATATDMERVREALGNRIITVSSGFRSERLNRAVNGSKTSYHMEGLAVDFVCRSFGTPLQICHALAGSALMFDQLIHEYGRWVHIGFPRKGEPYRRQLLTIDSSGVRVGLHEVANVRVG